MPTRYRAEHVVIFAVYRKMTLLGKPMRYLKVAYPDRTMAEDWVKKEADGTIIKETDFMIEEMPAIMKAWQL